MKIRYPAYYEDFRCISERCEDTCCAGWEIDIDDASYAYYLTVEGEFGSRLRRNIKKYEPDREDAYEQQGFLLDERKRCPFLNEKNLCEIYLELGEQALCDVCTDTPRNYLEYGGDRELSLSVACPEAGRLLFAGEEPIRFVEKEIDDRLDFEEGEEELALAEQIRGARDRSIAILQNRKLPLRERIIHFLHFAEQVQECLNKQDFTEVQNIDMTAYFSDSTDVERNDGAASAYNGFRSRLCSFAKLESINEEWESVISLLRKRYDGTAEGATRYNREQRELWRGLQRGGRIFEYEHLLVYYSFLFLPRCVDDYDYLGKAKMAVVSFLMLRDMDCVWRAGHGGDFSREDRVKTAGIYAKEVEHSGVNLELLADDLLFEDSYTVENLCLVLTTI